MIRMQRIRIRVLPKKRRRWWPGGLFLAMGAFYACTGIGWVPHTTGSKNQPPIELHFAASPEVTRIVGGVMFILAFRSVFWKRRD